MIFSNIFSNKYLILIYVHCFYLAFNLAFQVICDFCNILFVKIDILSRINED